MQWLIFGANMLAGDTLLRSLLRHMFLAKVGVDSERQQQKEEKKKKKKKKKKKGNFSVVVSNAIMQISALLCPVFLVPVSLEAKDKEKNVEGQSHNLSLITDKSLRMEPTDLP